jgi:hypothetical protein
MIRITTLAGYVLHGRSWHPDWRCFWRRANDCGQVGPASQYRTCLGPVAPMHEAPGPRQTWKLIMTYNVVGADWICRIVIDLVMAVLAATHAVRICGWVRVVPLATRLLCRSPAYTLFGIKTCTSEKA